MLRRDRGASQANRVDRRSGSSIFNLPSAT
jgi:hypothetical protein